MYSNLKGQARLEAEGRDVVMTFVDMHTLKECAIEYGFFLSDGSTPNGGAFHNALVRLGWKDKGASREGGTTVRKGKIKGCLPRRLDNAVLKGAGKVWDTDDEDWSEPTWEDFLIACNNVGGDHHGIENWIQSLSKRLKGDELSNFSDWIESNRANDAAIAAAAAKAEAAKPANRIATLETELAAAKARIEKLELDLCVARKLKPSGAQFGGSIDRDMLKILKQRFHPDRNNGSPELCNKVMQWLNAIVV